MQARISPLSTITEPLPLTSDDKELAILLDKYKPWIYLDKKEEYFPCSIDYYVQHSSLIIGDEEVAKPGEVNYETFMSKSLEEWREIFKGLGFKATGDFNFKPDESILSGQKDWRNEAKIYGRAFNVNIKDRDGKTHDLIAIDYDFTYAYDNPSGVISLFAKKGKTTGWHYGDMEHITVYVRKDADGKAGEIDRVYYAAHGSGEGKWYHNDKLTRLGTINEGTHPSVYVAKGTHASYGKPGTQWRIFGFANDVIRPTSIWKPTVSSDCRMYERNMNFGLDAVGTQKDFMAPQSNVKELSTTKFMQLFGVVFSTASDSTYESVKSKMMHNDHLLVSSIKMKPEEVRNALQGAPEEPAPDEPRF